MYLDNLPKDQLTQELEIEARYKALGQESAKIAFDTFKGNQEDVMVLKLGQKLVSYEFKQVQAAMQTFLTEALKPKRGVKPSYTVILEDLNDLYGVDRLDELTGLMTMASLSTLLTNALKKETINSNLAKLIADELYYEASLVAYLKANKKRLNTVLIGINKRVQVHYRRAYATAWMAEDKFIYPRWNRADAQQLGACLIQVVLASSSYFEDNGGDTNIYQILPSQALLDAWKKNEDNQIFKAYKLCPTILPPRPWTSFTDGGYYGELANTTTLLRVSDGRNNYASRYLVNLNQLKLETGKTAVNAIQGTKWRVNQKVLDVVNQIVDNGCHVAGIPSMTHKAPPPAVLPEDPTKEQLKKYKKVMVPYYRGETRRKSLALRVLSNLRVAKDFCKYDQFYIPCNMDFRGRVYPVPSFSFQGDDLNKSLIQFADVPGLKSDKDLTWFYITGANLAGVDKVSYEDRIKWIEDNETNILESAKDPLGCLWWSNQDCPCQMLAYCFEYESLKAYQKDHNGTAVGWKCGLVVAFDGTCSGLQHFSAILRDPVGAKAVNLIPGEKPSDIYAIVAAKVNKVLIEDARHGTEDLEKELEDEKNKTYIKYGTKSLALIWSTYGVTRKVTKRSVMTLAYGSKEYGFKDQLYEDIIKPDLDDKDAKSIFAPCPKQAAKYLAKLIWDAVGTTVVKAVEGMKWLQECSHLVTKNHNVVAWTTPAGLPVQQSYMECECVTYQLRVYGKRLRLYDTKLNGIIDNRKQAQGIAPNFIHSMDASHLQLTVANCYKAGIHHFAMVHDSYGTCLAHAQEMFDIVRKTFYQMYTDHDVLQDFRKDMQLLSPDKELPQPPLKGTLDLKCVLDSPYIFC